MKHKISVNIYYSLDGSKKVFDYEEMRDEFERQLKELI